MSIKIRIPKQDIAVKKIQYKGRDQEITTFMAQLEDGTNYPVCEAWGNKKKALEEVMGTDKLIEAEKIEHNQQYNKYNVFFPRGFGGEAEFRGKFGGGGGREWVPNGYKGKPVSTERFFSMTEKMMHDAVKICRHAMTAEKFDKLTPEQVAQYVLPVAQDLVSQHWIEVEKNVTFPDGCEPAAAPAVSSTGKDGGASEGAAAEKPEPSMAAILNELAGWTTADPEVKKAMTEKINAMAGITSEQRVELHGAVFSRMKELSRGA